MSTRNRLDLPRIALVAAPAVIAVAGAWTRRWVSEDAFINFRVIDNILGGRGPVFNVGERVEVYTDPLWVAILAGVHGVFQFVPLEWCSVVLGMFFTCVGFACGALASQRLGRLDAPRGIVPMGLLCASVVDAMWDFSTSGLETGLIFGWLGIAWLLLVRAKDDESSLWRAGAVASLGVTIRPDMAVFTLVFGAALLFLVRTRSPTPRRRRYALVVAALIAVPLASEVFRLAYFGVLVSNTAVAKSAFDPDWSRGWVYLADFVGPYWLGVPALLLGALAVIRSARWWRDGRTADLVVWLAPALGGVLDALYTVRVGGDFMHARFLLPAFFALSMTLWIDNSDKVATRLPLAVTAAWVLACLVGFRAVSTGTNLPASGIVNERDFWVTISANRHPVELADYTRAYAGGVVQLWDQQRLVAQRSGTRSVLFVGPGGEPVLVPAGPADLPQRLFVSTPLIGIRGYATASDVYLIDVVSIANPVGSRFALAQRGRPGHEKWVDAAWIVGGFAPSEAASGRFADPRRAQSAAAAVGCPPLASYLATIRGPLSFSKVVSNFQHALEWTTMRYSADPVTARSELCR